MVESYPDAYVTAVREVRSVVCPSPNLPQVLNPKATTFPVFNKIAVCVSPHETATALVESYPDASATP